MSEPTLRAVDGGAPATPSDDALMLRASAGDERAFEQLVARHQGSVRRYAATIVGDAAARDVAQEVFFQVWRRREAYRPEEKFKAYLFRAARNRCVSVLRRRRAKRFFALGDDEVAPDAPADVVLEDRERWADVMAAMGRLPEKHKTPLMMRFVEGLSYEDVAKVIGRTESTARSRVHYGLKRLADLLPEEVRS